MNYAFQTLVSGKLCSGQSDFCALFTPVFPLLQECFFLVDSPAKWRIESLPRELRFVLERCVCHTLTIQSPGLGTPYSRSIPVYRGKKFLQRFGPYIPDDFCDVVCFDAVTPYDTIGGSFGVDAYLDCVAVTKVAMAYFQCSEHAWSAYFRDGSLGHALCSAIHPCVVVSETK